MPSEIKTHWDRRKLAGLFGLGLLVAVGISVLMVVPEELQLLARPMRRRLTDGFLHSLRAAYGITLLLSFSSVFALGALMFRARRRRLRRPTLARCLLMSGSVLVGLALLECGAAVWLAWIHRVPTLPDQFAAEAERLNNQKLPRHVQATDVPSLPDRFAEPPERAVSLVVIGESSAQGFPYYPWVSVGQIVAWQLAVAMPERRFELNILAKGGSDLEMMHHKLAGLKRRPDAMIIYCGHNEFQARYPWSRTLRPPAPTLAVRMDLFERIFKVSPLCQMIAEAIDVNRLDAPPPLATRPLLDWPMCSEGEYATILADFCRRLEAIVAYCERLGTLPILVIPPANESGFEPSRTVLPGALSPDERAALTREFEAARTAEANPAQSVALYRALVARQPEFAEAHFRLARLLEDAGDWDDARWHYRRARDSDGLPIRFPTVFQDIYREVAARHDCILIDGPEVLRRTTAHGILDDTLFHDAHHPSLRAVATLGEAILRALRARNAFGWRNGPEPAVEPSACAAHFGMDGMRWWTVCQRTSEFYRHIAVTRYDPAERLAKAKRFAKAAQEIAGGSPPEATGLPGVGRQPNSRAAR